MPKVIKRRRTKGWIKPEGAVYVGRPTKWANPWKVGGKNPYGTITADRRHAASIFWGFASQNETLIAAAQAELKGKDLMCWCVDWDGENLPPGECHAETLLQLANKELEDGP